MNETTGQRSKKNLGCHEYKPGCKEKKEKKNKEKNWVWACDPIDQPNSIGLLNSLAQDPVGPKFRYPKAQAQFAVHTRISELHRKSGESDQIPRRN